MRMLKCDQCKEEIESGEQYYEKPKNSFIGMLASLDDAALKSSELHICTGCFAEIKRVINEVVPQLLGDFYLRNARGSCDT